MSSLGSAGGSQVMSTLSFVKGSTVGITVPGTPARERQDRRHWHMIKQHLVHYMHVLTLSTEEGLSHVTASLVGQVALVASEVGWLDIVDGQGVHCVADSGDTVLGTISTNNLAIFKPCHSGGGVTIERARQDCIRA